MTDAQIVVTGEELVGRGHRGFEPVVQEMIEGARSEVQLVAFVFTPAAIGLLDMVGGLADRGVQVTIVVNRLEKLKPEVKTWLKEAPRRWRSVKIGNFSSGGKRELHAKLCVVDRKRAVVGSANFTWGGLVSNYEVGVELHGESAWKLAVLVDELLAMCSTKA